MEQEEQQLRANALLLLRCERELVAVRTKSEHLTSWLRLAQSLPALMDRQLTVDAVYTRLRRALLARLRVQRVMFFELLTSPSGSTLRAIAPASGERPLAPDAAAVLEAQRCGACNAQNDVAALAVAVGLEYFLWSRIQVLRAAPVLLVIGFDKDKARFQSPFDETDAVHLGNMAQHVETLLGNLLLMNELERDRARLRQFNEDLAARTEELARANREIAGALGALTEKDARLRDDLEQARRFQQGILPKLPRSPCIAFDAVYRPVDVVGGDIFDVCEIAPGHFRVFLADATGHGVQASLRTIALKSEYDRLKQDQVTPDVLLTRYNRRLVEMFPRYEMLSTGCCFDVDFRAGAEPMLRYANAAHPPLLRVSGGVTEEIYVDGPFLGVAQRSPAVLRGFCGHASPGDDVTFVAAHIGETPA
jgi:hypothetical protein